MGLWVALLLSESTVFGMLEPVDGLYAAPLELALSWLGLLVAIVVVSSPLFL